MPPAELPSRPPYSLEPPCSPGESHERECAFPFLRPAMHAGRSHLVAWGCPDAREKATGGRTLFSSSALPCLQGGAALQPADVKPSAREAAYGPTASERPGATLD